MVELDDSKPSAAVCWREVPPLSRGRFGEEGIMLDRNLETYHSCHINVSNCQSVAIVYLTRLVISTSFAYQ